MKAFSKLLSSFISSKSSTSAQVLGIDVGSSSIKVVELEERGDVLTLSTYGEIQLGPYDAKEVGQAVVLDPKKEQQALIDVLRESAVRARQGVLAMPLSSSFVTIMSLPVQSGEDVGPRVRVEARKYIPTQISEVTLDWAEVTAGKNNSGMKDILVAAIQNEALKRFSSLMDFVGFKQPPSEIECFSAIRAQSHATVENFAIVDIGASSTKLYIVRSGLLQRMHRVRAGGAICTKRIGEALDISFDEAEIKKRVVREGAATYRDIVRAHRVGYERPFTELRQVLEEYEKTAGVKVSAIYLTGGGALFSDILGMLRDSLQKEVTLMNPFSKVAYPAFMEDSMRAIGPTFTVALGAALRAFD